MTLIVLEPFVGRVWQLCRPDRDWDTIIREPDTPLSCLGIIRKSTGGVRIIMQRLGEGCSELLDNVTSGPANILSVPGTESDSTSPKAVGTTGLTQ